MNKIRGSLLCFLFINGIIWAQVGFSQSNAHLHWMRYDYRPMYCVETDTGQEVCYKRHDHPYRTVH